MIRSFLGLACLVASSCAWSAVAPPSVVPVPPSRPIAPIPPPPSSKPVPVEPASFDFLSIPVSQAITLYYKEVSKRPYVVCDDVLADVRQVSMRGSGKALDGPVFASMLDLYGYEAKDNGLVVTICKKPVPVAGSLPAPDYPTMLYKVKFRDAGYLIDLLGGLVKGTFANKRVSSGVLAVGGGPAVPGAVGPVAGSPPAPASSSSGGSYSSSTGDEYIVFSGPEKEAVKLRSLLAQLDVSSGEVVVKAYMYEVGKNSSDGTALSMVASVLGGRVQASAGAGVLDNLLRLKTASIDLVASALATDGRFKVVTAPFVRLRSGKTARFVSGAQVPVLGAIVTNQNGGTTQSYDRIESGTILEVSPVVHGENVDLDLFQQVSSFVADSARGAPQTLNKRELRTSLSMQDGEVVVIAGLSDAKDDDSKTGVSFLPFVLGKSKTARSSELILVLEMKRI
jgi:general secretion pathway protein D